MILIILIEKCQFLSILCLHVFVKKSYACSLHCTKCILVSFDVAQLTVFFWRKKNYMWHQVLFSSHEAWTPIASVKKVSLSTRSLARVSNKYIIKISQVKERRRRRGWGQHEHSRAIKCDDVGKYILYFLDQWKICSCPCSSSCMIRLCVMDLF